MAGTHADARDFLTFDEASRTHAAVSAMGFELRHYADTWRNRTLRQMTVRLVWRNRYRDSIVLMLRIPLPR